jgi:hypothetical protein
MHHHLNHDDVARAPGRRRARKGAPVLFPFSGHPHEHGGVQVHRPQNALLHLALYAQGQTKAEIIRVLVK